LKVTSPLEMEQTLEALASIVMVTVSREVAAAVGV
jgi:hypothetical protein